MSVKRSSVNPAWTLRALIGICALAPLESLLHTESPVPMSTRAVAATLWLLTLVPAWHYLGMPHMRRSPMPFMPIIGFVYGLYYALPAVLGAYGLHWRIALDPRVDYDEACLLALYGWCMLSVGFYLTRFRGWRGAAFARKLAPEGVSVRVLLVVLCVGVGMSALQQLVQIPLAIRSLVQFMSTLQRVAGGMMIVLWLRGELSRGARILLSVALVADFGVQIATGSMSNAALAMLSIIMAVWIERGYIRTSAIAVSLAGVMLLLIVKGVLGDYREVAWYGRQASPVDGAVTMATMVYSRVEADGISGAVAKGSSALIERSANLDLFADVVRRTPSEVPFWNGATYTSLVGIAVPRFLWPDKPVKHLGQDFGHRYSYIDPKDDHTSVNLPVLVEFYANFGSAGVVFGSFLVGVIYGMLDRWTNRPSQPILVSIIGMSLLLPLTNIESDFSLTLGGLILSFCALYIVRRTLKLLRGARRPRQRLPVLHSSAGRST